MHSGLKSEKYVKFMKFASKPKNCIIIPFLAHCETHEKHSAP